MTTGALQDQIGPHVRVLFVGINPGLRSAATGHHFAGYSNRFWKLLFESGLVPQVMTCEDDGRLPEWGFGITNIVPRATAGIDTLTKEDFRAGAQKLLKKIDRCRPDIVALVGVTVWRALAEALELPNARSGKVALGLQKTRIHGGFPRAAAARGTRGARVFVLPNPSGRNATLSYDEMRAAFRALRRVVARR